MQRRLGLKIVALVGLLSVACAVPTVDINDPSTIPEQIHLSWGEDASVMVLTWATEANITGEVRWGSSSGQYTMKQAASTSFFSHNNAKGRHNIHRAVMTGLNQTQKYFYVVACGASVSDEFFFTARNDDPSFVPQLLIYGDMGKHGGAPSLQKLIEKAESGWATAAIHMGDYAYDLRDDDGVNGDQFMNRIQPIATKIPYMGCPGNHEIEDGTFSNYVNRFTMPGNTSNMWYSFNLGRAHFIAYSSEVYFTQNEWTVDAQMEWLLDDLKAANANRAERPWIIAFGHRPMYCSNADHDDCTEGPGKSKVRAGLEELFFSQGVDLILEAHEHSYERLYPVYNMTVTGTSYANPTAPVHIISGAAGCNEASGMCLNPILRKQGPWSAKRDWFFHYGFGQLTVHNSTHIYWEQLLDTSGLTLDSLWLTQDKHGPFPAVVA